MPVVAADTALGSESIVNSNVSVLSLQRPVEEWCSEIAKRTGTERIPEAEIRKNFADRHFLIDREAQALRKYFCGLQ